MSKKQIIIISLILLAVILTALVAWYVWYSFFDTVGLVFYDGEPIAEITPYRDQAYLTDDEGRVFLVGGYASTGNRKYRNVEAKENNELDCARPVLIFDGSAKAIIPYGHLHALIISSEGELYDFRDLELSSVLASDVISAYYADGGTVYYIDESATLFKVGEDNALAENVKRVVEYNGYLYILYHTNELTVVDKSENRVTETITGVEEFSLINTSDRFIDGRLVTDDPSGLSNPLFTLLTTDGELRVKGAYNHLTVGNRVGATPSHKIFESWTLVERDVVAFASSEIGTVYIKSDGTVGYHGFDSIPVSDAVVNKTTLNIDAPKSVAANGTVVIVKGAESFYVWGDEFNLTFDRLSDEHGILSGEPIELSINE